MGRELLLLRHGKSDRDAVGDDYHRPLKDRGKRGAQRIGTWLAQHNLIPDRVLTSPAERALVTAQKCCKVFGWGGRQIQRDRRIYLATPQELLAVIAECPPETGRIMLVGHNPGLEMLIDELSDAPLQIPANGKLMPTATLAQLAVPGEWSELQSGQARLLQLVRASSLPEKFPYPDASGMELRDRPAYYYTQSSVIPYRLNHGRVEILLIRSSQNKHWVVPKGIVEPGLTLQDSAAKEAREEAGVEGEVWEESVGSYNYQKWGSTCTVTVYPMPVKRQLPESEWEESHRGREWVSPAEAAARLKQVELGPMLMTLAIRLTEE